MAVSNNSRVKRMTTNDMNREGGAIVYTSKGMMVVC